MIIIYFINEIIPAFDKAESRGHGIKNSAAQEELYKAGEECENLSPDKAKIFHNLMANIL